MIKIAMFDSKSYDKESFSNLNKSYKNIDIHYYEVRLSIHTVRLTKGYDGVIVFVNDELDKFVIDKLIEYNVKAIFLRCAGFNNIDISYAYNKIHIFRVPSYSPYAVGEFAMALIHTLNRRIHKAYNRTKEFNFSLEGLTGMDLYNKTIGVIGTGKIGKVFIDICKGYHMNVIAYDPYPNIDIDVKYVSLENLFKSSDIISLHCPLTEDSKYIINKSSISMMKKGVMIINTSRGGLIDSTALLEGIKSRHIGSVALDVYEEEANIFYLDKSNHILDDGVLRDLISMPNVIVTSHQAFLTKEALFNIASTTFENISKFFNNIINSENEICYLCGKQTSCSKKRNEKCF